MSYDDSSINDGYELECVRSLPIHIKNATNIIVSEPEDGYKRIVKLADFPRIDFENCPFIRGEKSNDLIDRFEVDFIGHATNDFQDISPIRHEYCDDFSSQQVFYSNFIEGDVHTSTDSAKSAGATLKISPNKDSSTSSVKYVIAEISHAVSNTSSAKKVQQIERCLWFLKEKTGSSNIEDCVALALIVGPGDKFYNGIISYVSKKRTVVPLTARLSAIGRFAFIENCNTLVNNVAHFREDIQKLNDSVAVIDLTLSDVKTVVSNQFEAVRDEVAAVKDQFKLIVKFLTFIATIIIVFLVYAIFFNFQFSQYVSNQFDL
jgi:hypothetical protein